MHRPLVLGGFEEFTSNFIANTWHHPQADTAGFASLVSWQDLAGRLDDAGFDFLFFADAVGYPMDDAGSSLRRWSARPCSSPSTTRSC